MKDCPGCTFREDKDGRLHPLGKHLEDCDGWQSDAIERMRANEWMEGKAEAHRTAIRDGCQPGICDHPLNIDSPEGWLGYHKALLAHEERMIDITREKMRGLAEGEPL
jgi:hypothetical protein